MNIARPPPDERAERIDPMPAWVTQTRTETPENVAFMSGAALAVLDGMLSRDGIPNALLRERLALGAAVACVAMSGRSERAGELRDEVHLLRPGDRPGPAGAVFAQWRRAVGRPLSTGLLRQILPDRIADRVPGRTRAAGSFVARAAQVLDSVLKTFPRQEASALIAADAALARALGWEHLMPLLAAGLARRDLRKTGDDLRAACHRAVLASAGGAVRMAADLTWRAERLRAVAPKLRAKGAGQAVEVFLSRDALSPSIALTGAMGDRAARRLCDRLVALGAVRELTGRATSRLYGI